MSFMKTYPNTEAIITVAILQTKNVVTANLIRRIKNGGHKQMKKVFDYKRSR